MSNIHIKIKIRRWAVILLFPVHVIQYALGTRAMGSKLVLFSFRS